MDNSFINVSSARVGEGAEAQQYFTCRVWSICLQTLLPARIVFIAYDRPHQPMPFITLNLKPTRVLLMFGDARGRFRLDEEQVFLLRSLLVIWPLSVSVCNTETAYCANMVQAPAVDATKSCLRDQNCSSASPIVTDYRYMVQHGGLREME